MPAFALANSGVSLTGTSIPIDQILLSPVFLGIFFGLVVGKPLGITLLSWICVKLGLCEMPQKTSWNMLMGVACLGGIGFTMSIFVTNLAFTGAHAEQFVIISKTAILISSLTAGILGFNLLNLMSKKKFKNPHNYIS
jgi:NhaA family Na+:H+ antiporter